MCPCLSICVRAVRVCLRHERVRCTSTVVSLASCLQGGPGDLEGCASFRLHTSQCSLAQPRRDTHTHIHTSARTSVGTHRDQPSPLSSHGCLLLPLPVRSWSIRRVGGGGEGEEGHAVGVRHVAALRSVPRPSSSASLLSQGLPSRCAALLGSSLPPPPSLHSPLLRALPPSPPWHRRLRENESNGRRCCNVPPSHRSVHQKRLQPTAAECRRRACERTGNPPSLRVVLSHVELRGGARPGLPQLYTRPSDAAACWRCQGAAQ